MKLYDDMIQKTFQTLESLTQRSFSLTGEEGDWKDQGKAMMILQADMAYELGGRNLSAVGTTLVTEEEGLVPEDEILLYGPDLSEISEDTSYARIALVRVKKDSVGTGNGLYNIIQNLGYFRYHFFPEGFMLRVSAANDRESVRVSKDALDKGLSFGAIGKGMIKALRLHKEVEAVKIVFVTDPGADFTGLEEISKRTKQITSTIDHMLKDVNMDCNSCGLQEVCDEVEGLREMHFGMSEDAGQ